MEFNNEVIDEILNSIFPLPDDFGMVIHTNHDDDAPCNIGLLEELLYDIDPAVEIRFGVTKLVIYSPRVGENVVLKIPFNGYFEEIEDEEEPFWHPFEWAPASDRTDYCLAEYEKYKNLKSKRLSCFVAKTFLYKVVNGIRVFVQEYAVPGADMYNGHSASFKSQTLAKDWREKYGFNIDSEWIANCIDKYGVSIVKRFLTYCDKEDPDLLEDGHSGNYGYRDNGTPCLIDYSNFID